jgi:AAHS family benzoate transporter-like MFS transporter/AAHS family 4-hydroxybenzoate transporter-like MFS transporter
MRTPSDGMIASMFSGVSTGRLADRMHSGIREMIVGYIVAALFMAALAVTLCKDGAMVPVAGIGFSSAVHRRP